MRLWFLALLLVAASLLFDQRVYINNINDQVASLDNKVVQIATNLNFFRAPPGMMSIRRIESNEKHSQYSFCMGILDAFEFLATGTDKPELAEAARTHREYFRARADNLRAKMVKDGLFRSGVDVVTFDIASDAVYKDGQDFVLHNNPNETVNKLKHCVDLIQP